MALVLENFINLCFNEFVKLKPFKILLVCTQYVFLKYGHCIYSNSTYFGNSIFSWIQKKGGLANAMNITIYQPGGLPLKTQYAI